MRGLLLSLAFLSQLAFGEAAPPPPGVSRVDTPAHGLQLSEAPQLGRDVHRGVFDGGDRTSAVMPPLSCVFQAESSPPQGNTLDTPEMRGRSQLGLMGPEKMLRACRSLRASIGERKCKRVFLGGHNGTDSVGVLDLFYLHPRAAVDPATPEGLTRLIEWRKRLSFLPSVDPIQTRRRALEMIFDPNGPCYPGPLGNPPDDQGGQREAGAAEQATFRALLACFDDILDHGSPEQTVVMSACGPLNETHIAEHRVSEVGIGQEVCGRVLADALGTRVLYSRGINGSPVNPPVYDTSPYGHRLVAPSNWSEIRPR